MAYSPRKKIVALIPCYNEEYSIGQVIQSFPREKINNHGFELEIMVIDNNSRDRTAQVARDFGATVIQEPKKGKGNAIRRGFYSIPADSDYVVMLDGDSTYRPEEILRLVDFLDSDFCSVVIGSRLDGWMRDGSMKTFNRLGNRIYSFLVRFFYNANVTDALTGYFAWKREAVERLRPHLTSNGFDIEMEMITKMARLKEEICSVPISYHLRVGKTNLNPVFDSVLILKTLVCNLYWRPGRIGAAQGILHKAN